MDKQPDRFQEQKRRSFWLKHLHQWHWISSAICLVAMLLFAATGITLNHAAQIEAKPSVVAREGVLPEPLARALAGNRGGDKAPLPPELRAWLGSELAVAVDERDAEWSPDEIYVSLPRPGGDAWVSIELPDGAVRYESTDRGWISYFNDLHKGRNTGEAWKWFLDIFAVACLVFCVTGFFLLHIHARNRPVTWPMVALGVAVPLFLAIVFIH
ncbi:PepSY-associated TM helix [Pigmentiphaga humi]|uniref:PepSY-associated TM helix n=1 Tax=Pigmentiphaga humi TaxID=2478468 RepID=A0A3P4B505_9BURK|nr:PepSY-associated TM helix domain-containing protein [Pigmentiphaga humi]VCU70748.1 PepSY-associated TM helix [Pigmentiphaga humi]